MNFNTFFLDKLSMGDQSPALNLKKGVFNSSLFSDIIKVCEQETAVTAPVNTTAAPSLVKQGSIPSADDVIECDSSKLQSLSQFIQDFINGSQESVISPEVLHDLNQVLISKKQFILPAASLEDFIKGLAQKLALISSPDSETPASQGPGKADAQGVFNIQAAASQEMVPASDGKKENKEKLPEQSVAIGQSLINYLQNNNTLNLSFKSGSEKITISIKELPEDNLENKLNFDKLSADFNTAGGQVNNSGVQPSDKPAEYFLATLNLSSQLASASGNEVKATSAPGTVPDAAKLDTDGIYKTEVVQISLKPINAEIPASLLSKDFPVNQKSAEKIVTPVQNQEGSTEGAFKIFNLGISSPVKTESEPGKLNLSVSQNAAAEIPNTILPLQKLSAVEPAKINIPAPTVEGEEKNTGISNLSQIMRDKTVFNISDFSAKQVSTDNKPLGGVQLPDKVNSTPESVQKADLSGKAILSELNFVKSGTASTSDAQTSGQQVPENNFTPTEVPGKNALDELNKLMGQEISLKKALSTQEKVVLNPLEKKTAGTIEKPGLSPQEKQQSGIEENARQKPQEKVLNVTPETKIIASPEKKTFNPQDQVAGEKDLSSSSQKMENKTMTADLPNSPSADLKNLAATQTVIVNTKTEVKDATIDAASDGSGSVAGANIQDTKESVRSAENKSSGEKDLSKQKSNDGFKNVLQSSDQTNEINSGKFKNLPDMKPVHETVKIIKAPELVNEFSKVIQSGEKQSMTFQLSPENLGKVKLTVDLVNNQIHTHIEVENENVKQFIQSNVEQLKQNLQSSGINISQLNISLSDPEQKFARTPITRKKTGGKVSKIDNEVNQTSKAQKTLGYNTYEYLA